MRKRNTILTLSFLSPWKLGEKSWGLNQEPLSHQSHDDPMQTSLFRAHMAVCNCTKCVFLPLHKLPFVA